MWLVRRLDVVPVLICSKSTAISAMQGLFSTKAKQFFYLMAKHDLTCDVEILCYYSQAKVWASKRLKGARAIAEKKESVKKARGALRKKRQEGLFEVLGRHLSY